jgi:hypothetical protein
MLSHDVVLNNMVSMVQKLSSQSASDYHAASGGKITQLKTGLCEVRVGIGEG